MKTLFFSIPLFLHLFLMANCVYAKPLLSNVTTEHSGYISDVRAEREQQFYEIFLIAPSLPAQTPTQEVIFNKQLSTEFKDKYRERFGQLDTESIIYQPTKFSILDENRGATQKVEEANKSRSDFGEFMIKRLSEWHIDNYFKTDPTMRPVYELKEKLSNVEVQVTKETKANIRYSLSVNEADVVVESAYFDISKYTLMMNPKQFGPGQVEEQKITLENQINERTRLNNSATISDGILKSEIIRTLKMNWATSLSVTAAYKSGQPSPRETRYLVGLTHSW